MSFRSKAILFLSFISFASYQVLLGSKGFLERKEFKKSLEQSKFELERTIEENKNLRERSKISLDESRLLEKEARKYYLMRNDSHILKFVDHGKSKLSEEKDRKNFWKRLWEARVSGERIPPLDVLRVFHVSFSVFLILGVFFSLRKQNDDEEIHHDKTTTEDTN